MAVVRLPPRPKADVPFVDPKTGRINREWLLWLDAVIRLLNN